MSKYKELEEFIYNYPTKYKEGFISKEMDVILKDFPTISMDKYENAMMGNTCHFDKEDGCIIYHCDVLKALIAGLENRELYNFEFD